MSIQPPANSPANDQINHSPIKSLHKASKIQIFYVKINQNSSESVEELKNKVIKQQKDQDSIFQLAKTEPNGEVFLYFMRKVSQQNS